MTFKELYCLARSNYLNEHKDISNSESLEIARTEWDSIFENTTEDFI